MVPIFIFTGGTVAFKHTHTHTTTHTTGTCTLLFELPSSRSVTRLLISGPMEMYIYFSISVPSTHITVEVVGNKYPQMEGGTH